MPARKKIGIDERSSAFDAAEIPFCHNLDYLVIYHTCPLFFLKLCCSLFSVLTFVLEAIQVGEKINDKVLLLLLDISIENFELIANLVQLLNLG